MTRSRFGVSVGFSLGLFVSGCSGDDGDSAAGKSGGAGGDSNVFGGAAGGGGVAAGAGGSAGASAGTSGSGSGASGGRCAAAPPVVEFRIDNFEDGNDAPVSEPHRRGNWGVSAVDGQPIPSFVVEEGGADGTDFAAHVSNPEFTENSLALSLRTEVDGQGCPYNAAGTLGIGLFTKGTGRVNFKVSLDDIFTLEWGGTCDELVSSCWDAHGKLIPLSEDWTYREIRWSDLSQAGWGDAFAFDPSGIMNFIFAAASPDEPVELWVDELSFLPAAAENETGAE